LLKEFLQFGLGLHPPFRHHRMAGRSDVAIPASAAVIIAKEVTIPRDCSLVGSDLQSRFVVSDGCSKISFFDNASTLVPNSILSIEHLESIPNGGTSTISFVNVSPSQHFGGPVFTALASGCKLTIFSGGGNTDDSERARSLGTLLSIEPHRWLGACWHPRLTGLLSVICQAEIRLVLCTVQGTEPKTHRSLEALPLSKDKIAGSGSQNCPKGSVQALQVPPGSKIWSPLSVATGEAIRAAVADGTRAATETTESSHQNVPTTTTPLPHENAPRELLLHLSRLQPHAVAMPDGTTSSGPCRSVQCHVAWVGDAVPAPNREQSNGTAQGEVPAFPLSQHKLAEPEVGNVLTLVVCWGSDIELVSWSTAALWKTATAAAAAITTTVTAVKASTGSGVAVPTDAAVAAVPGVQGAIAATPNGNSNNSIDSGEGGSGALLPISRRKLLLGVSGPLCAVSLGPHGSVLVTSEAGLALSCSPLMKQRPCGMISSAGRSPWGEGQPLQQGQEQQLQQQEKTQEVQKRHEQQQEQDQQPDQPDHKGVVIDLRGTWGMAAGDFSPIRPITRDSPCPSSQGADARITPLPSLFNIAAGLTLDDGEDCGNGRDASSSGRSGGVRTLQDASGSGAAVPKQLLLERRGKGLAAPTTVASGAQSSLPGSSATLCVVWPGHVGPGPTQADSTLKFAHAGPALDRNVAGGFCSFAPLQLQRPDLLSYCGAVVLAASCMGPPLVAAFRLAPYGGGLTLLSYLTPTWPSEMICASHGRLRGLGAVLAGLPVSAATASGEWKGQCQGESWGAEYDSKSVTRLNRNGEDGQNFQSRRMGPGAEVMLVLVAGEVESPPAGSGIFGFSRSGRPLGQKIARLVASVHPLPSAAATAATPNATDTGTTNIAIAEDTGPAALAIHKSQFVSDVTHDSAAGSASSIPPQADTVMGLFETCRDDFSIGANGHPAAVRHTAAAATVTVKAAATAMTGPPADAIPTTILSQFAELLADFRRHVDQRLDVLAASLEAQTVRLSRIEAALVQRNQGDEVSNGMGI
ncbi:hypothetical protein Vretifemale_12664, partial [Volvox reticuliferus]